jgi:hypothetical protein
MVEKVVSGAEREREEFMRLQQELGILPGPVPLPERPTARVLGMDVDLHTGIPPELVRKLNETTADIHVSRKLLDADLSGDPVLRQKALRFRELSGRLNPPKEKGK